MPTTVAVVLALGCDRLWPLPIGRNVATVALGVALLGVVAVLIVSGLRAFERHGTTASTTRETTALIDTGPFKLSRNPGYLTLQILQIALGLLLDSGWILLMVVPAWIVVDRVIVRGEEAYLERQLGDPYRAYKARVRRWL